MATPASSSSEANHNNNTHHTTVLTSAIAGAVAGFGARACTAPLDLWRIRRQLQPTHRVGILQGLSQIYKTEGGFPSLFRGNVAATYLWMGYAAVQFAVYDATIERLPSLLHDNNIQDNHNNSTSSVGLHFFAGALAGSVATLATYPLDLCRTTFAAKGLVQTTSTTSSTAGYAPKSLQEFTIKLYQRKGLSGFFAGGGPALVQIIPYMGLNFALHDYLVYTYFQDDNITNSTTAGAISGGLSKLVVYPLDTAKKRLQAQAAFGVSQQQQQQVFYKNMVHCLHTIYTREGIAAWYGGLVPSVLKNTVATALSFGVFTLTKDTLDTLQQSPSHEEEDAKESTIRIRRQTSPSPQPQQHAPPPPNTTSSSSLPHTSS